VWKRILEDIDSMFCALSNRLRKEKKIECAASVAVSWALHSVVQAFARQRLEQLPG
jgi:hypothetical protein